MQPVAWCLLCLIVSSLLLAEQLIFPLFVGLTLHDPDLPQILQPKATVRGISSWFPFGSLSAWQTKPAVLGFVFLFSPHSSISEVRKAESIQTPTAISTTCGSGRGRHRERSVWQWEASFPGGSGGTKEDNEASCELWLCNATWGKIAIKSYYW